MKINEGGIDYIGCDFCEAKIPELDLKNTISLWTYGHRGAVMPLGNYCGQLPETKNSCPNDLCKAKLFVWART